QRSRGLSDGDARVRRLHAARSIRPRPTFEATRRRMKSLRKPPAYDDIPGTTVFDAQRARQGYHLNMFCMSLMKAENREAFKANERAYLDRWPMSEEQKQAVLSRDWNRMIYLGSNIYFLAKLFFTDQKSFQYVA